MATEHGKRNQQKAALMLPWTWEQVNNSQVNNVVYKCDVSRPFPRKVYLGLAEGKWKSRFYNHKLSFKHKRYSKKKTQN